MEMKIFNISRNENIGRWLILEKGVIYQTKLLYEEHNNTTTDDFPIGLELVQFDKAILDFHLVSLISNAIKYLLCYEANDSDFKMCRKLFSEEYKGNDEYSYRLDDSMFLIMKKRMQEFLDNYMNKAVDKNMLPHEAEHALLNTIEHAKKDVVALYNIPDYKTHDECKKLYARYISLFELSGKRVKGQKLNKFRLAMLNANMNYIMRYNGEYIYPFIFDLLVMNFALMLMKIKNKESLADVQSMAKNDNAFKNKFYDKNSFEAYMHQDFKHIAEVLPKEFEDMTIMFIKHYSKVLNTTYDNVAVVLRQLHSDVSVHAKPLYKMPKKLINSELFIDEDYLRLLSLDII